MTPDVIQALNNNNNISKSILQTFATFFMAFFQFKHCQGIHTEGLEEVNKCLPPRRTYWVRHLTFFFSTSAYFVNGNS